MDGVNIMLFEREEVRGILPLGDARARHVLSVLRRGVGDSFDAGIVDGPRGKATLEEIGEEGLRLSFSWGEEDGPLLPIDLLVGLCRPQTCRKILQEATALGARRIRFVVTDRSEPSYAGSRLWSSGEWRQHLVEGAAQAFSTRLPDLRFDQSLEEGLEELAEGEKSRIALDNYESSQRLGLDGWGSGSVALAVGSERGWTGRERGLLRDSGYELRHLGPRVLRTETAVVAAVAVVREGLAKLGGAAPSEEG